MTGEVWRIEHHVCQRCFGRVLSRGEHPERQRLYRCADCGLEAHGASAHAICSCGMKLGGKTDLGIRCVPNTQKTEEFLVEICAQQN